MCIRDRHWDAYRRERLAPGTTQAEHDFAGYFTQIDTLRAENPGDARRAQLLDALADWGRGLHAQLHPSSPLPITPG